jgi:4-amino-4-deoxy-L-arabinose transferase-like glycosyltransferase
MVIIILMGTGALLVAAGLARYALDAFRQKSADLQVNSTRSPETVNWIYMATLFLILLVALLLRLEGIDLRGMSHVEVYIPGISLPPLISEPPPRYDFFTMLSWHWHDEPHPQAYYVLMFFWVKLFGTSLEALRIPSVLFGAGAVWLIYVLGSMAYDRRIGLISAALLALNGHHIYWSQNARMYAMACFLALASAVLLLSLLRGSSRRPLVETGYVGVTLLGLYTQLFFWPFLAAQMLLVLMYSRYERGNISRLFSLQALAGMLGSPMWAHAVYRSREIDLGTPSLSFLQDFINFGFTYIRDYFTSVPPRDVSSGIELAATGLALACLLGGLLNRRYRLVLESSQEPLSAWRMLIPVAVGFSLVIVALAISAWWRQGLIAVTSIVPLLLLVSVPAMYYSVPRIRSVLGGAAGRRQFMDSGVVFLLMLGLSPALFLVLVSFFKTMMIERGFLLFVPFLLVIQAAGVEYIARRRILVAPLLVALLAVHMHGIDFHRKVPGPHGYGSLAQQIHERMEPEDLLFVYPEDWLTTPLFYYFTDYDRIIGNDYVAVMADRPNARVWLPLITLYKPASEAMREALQGHVIVDHISAHNIEAYLYAPAGKHTPLP